MEIIKRKENYKNPVSTAMKNYRAIAFMFALVTLLTIFFEETRMLGYISVFAFVYLLITAFLVNRKNIWGVYLGYIFVLLGLFNVVTTIIMNNEIITSILPLIVSVYIAYWNFKAHNYIKNSLPNNSEITVG